MITILDWPIALLYLTIILVIGWFWSKRYNEHVKKVFFWGLVAHILGGLAFAFIYEFYYGGGDTFYYFSGGKKFIGVLFENPAEYVDLLFTSYDNVTVEQAYYVKDIQYFRSNELWLMVRITSVFTFFGMGQFLSTTILFSLVGFSANWLIYKSFKEFSGHKYLFIVMFLPSVIFWGNGIMKDTYVFFAVAFSFFTIVKLFNKTFKNNIEAIVYFILSFLFMTHTYTLKPYVVAVFLVCFLVALYIWTIRVFKSKLIQFVYSIVTTMVVIGLFYMLQQTVVGAIQSAEEQAVHTLKGFHSWHTELGGSTYSLGEMDYTVIGVVRKMPASLVVTYFRPFIWEVSSPLMILSLIESLFFLGVFAVAMIHIRKVKLSKLLGNPSILFMFVFALMFGFVVGLTTYNFGALARYKIVCIPFYVGFLLLISGKEKFNIKQ